MSEAELARASGGYRLVVRSIGGADAAVVSALRSLRRCPDAELAGLLYRAPSELLSGLTHEAGTRLCEVLRQTGVAVDLLSSSETYEPGTGDWELALVVRRYDRVPAILEETMRILGVDATTAKRLVCATPAVLMGRVSIATVEALRQRYERVGATVDASCTPKARFDVAIQVNDEASVRHVGSLLNRLAVKASSGGFGKFLVTDVDNAVATEIWNELSRTPAKVRVLNRDFHRFDVRLDRAEPSPALREFLTSAVGMPPAVADRALTQLPLIVKTNVGSAEMLELLEGIHARGGQASAILLALQSFALHVERGGDWRAARSAVETIAGPAAAASFDQPARAVSGRGVELPGPFTKTQAKWLQHELRRHEVKSHLVER